MNLSMKYIILYVSDSQRSIHFYQHILGLPIRAEHGTYVEFDTGSTILALNTRESVKEMTPLEIPETPVSSQTFEIGFVTENVEAVIKKVREHGVTIIGEPKVKPWGQTVAYIADPDGHYIEICSPME
ncbi:VOC family protein [Bacillus mojavensis]|uniref:Lactoylglutathione lyase YsfE n=1 Tax=Bacillus mojavensis TaxID=72360 RepID=A0ABX6LZC2_BACMO|nr:VOC family protein [Bacillus mojavensis]MCY8106405.1 VOC family protein [Bacillus mojavensis]MCY8482757.1 VOC family protein [Bacillus mojavensis]MCY9091797.1 VOC family protein [Bacillus mojavensis]MDR4226669.1 VOC family protein [Bacillus mojavensis]MEC1289845.1 VOC family protein [Bacillus mojavensis]